MSPAIIGIALALLGVLLYVGKLVRLRSTAMQNLFLPSSIIGGFIALLLGPGALGALVRAVGGEEAPLAEGLIPAPVLEVWAEVPGLLINVVFATLLLGVVIPKLRQIWELGGPQLAFGLTLGSGQYVIGILLAVLILGPVFGLPVMAGALIEIGFEGGHGTAAGLQQTFEDLDFAAGGELAVGMATVGVVGGIVCGIILINWAVRHDKLATESDREISRAEKRGLVPLEDRPVSAANQTVRPESIEPLTIHFALTSMAVLIGLGIWQALVTLENATWGGEEGLQLFVHVPLFPLAMIGGVIVQMIMQRYDPNEILDRDTVLRIQGFALDLLIIAAIASLSLEVIASNIGAFLVLGVAGIAWNVAAFWYLAPRIIRRFWFERGIGDLGQSMGVTATGLILMKIADPEDETPALEAFGYKQLAFEPFFGGGLITGVSVPFIAQVGPWPLFGIMVVLLIIGLAGGLLYFGRMQHRDDLEDVGTTPAT